MPRRSHARKQQIANGLENANPVPRNPSFTVLGISCPGFGMACTLPCDASIRAIGFNIRIRHPERTVIGIPADEIPENIGRCHRIPSRYLKASTTGSLDGYCQRTLHSITLIAGAPKSFSFRTRKPQKGYSKKKQYPTSNAQFRRLCN
ncbi:MAG: hypothetical protein DME45_00730 [Verrucomicrobia bacterium]|nr:MAG: hypothetical protein DME45_00730 [Verrucomicrobiota bacterium]